MIITFTLSYIIHNMFCQDILLQLSLFSRTFWHIFFTDSDEKLNESFIFLKKKDNVSQSKKFHFLNLTSRIVFYSYLIFVFVYILIQSFCIRQTFVISRMLNLKRTDCIRPNCCFFKAESF